MKGQLPAFLRSPHSPGKGLRPPFSRHSVLEAAWILRIFYLLVLNYALLQIPLWERLGNPEGLTPLWPVLWLEWIPNTAAGARGILVVGLASAFLGILAPGNRWIRILVFLGLLQFLALRYSFGKIGHSMHLWLMLSFLFIWLPHGWNQLSLAPVQTRRKLLFFIHAAQALILLTYSMSGLGKVIGAIYQLSQGQIHAFHPSAMAYHIADRLLQTGSQTPLGRFLVESTWLSWPILPLTIYIQFFALWIAFRPNLHRLWGALLMGMHLGSSLVLGIHFNASILLLALFLLYSPFRPVAPNWKESFRALPLLGKVAGGRRLFPAR